MGLGRKIMPGEARLEPSDLIAEAVRIVDGCRKAGRVIRLYGGAAIYYHCPGNIDLFKSIGRKPGDIDLAAYQKDASKLAEAMSGMGYEEDLTVSAFGGGRLVFRRRTDALHCDVLLGKLEMSHVLTFDGRLELEYPTAPLADLLLSKLQIFRLNEKDIIDTAVLLREHQLGGEDAETVDIGYVSSLCSKDWGLWKTTSGNLKKIASVVPGYGTLKEGDKADILDKLGKLRRAIEDVPKSLAWKVRARVGESRKWYNDVEDLFR